MHFHCAFNETGHSILDHSLFLKRLVGFIFFLLSFFPYFFLFVCLCFDAASSSLFFCFVPPFWHIGEDLYTMNEMRILFLPRIVFFCFSV